MGPQIVFLQVIVPDLDHTVKKFMLEYVYSKLLPPLMNFDLPWQMLKVITSPDRRLLFVITFRSTEAEQSVQQKLAQIKGLSIVGYWTLNTEHWTLDTEHWIFNS